MWFITNTETPKNDFGWVLSMFSPGGKAETKYTPGYDNDDYTGHYLDYQQVEGGDSFPAHLALYEVELPDQVAELTIAYEGVIYEPPQEEATLEHVRGGTTTGIISEEGIYLDAGSGWYPAEEDALPTFEFTLTVPEPHMLVTQGDLVSRRTEDGRDVSVWSSRVPQDGFTLVGNEFDWNTKAVYAVFDYTGMQDGTAWTVVWSRNGSEVAREDHFWDASRDGRGRAPRGRGGGGKRADR